jgi:polyphosphate kinase
VRGQCTLVPGLRGISSRIRVRSIVGRFLEHSRIFYFENGGTPEIYLGSSDWMPRNLYERVEVLFPLKDAQLKERITREILPAYLGDTRKARVLGADGIYTSLRTKRGGKGISVQDELMKVANGHVNGSANSSGRKLALAYTTNQSATAPVDPAVTLDLEAEDSSNATV